MDTTSITTRTGTGSTFMAMYLTYFITPNEDSKSKCKCCAVSFNDNQFINL